MPEVKSFSIELNDIKNSLQAEVIVGKNSLDKKISGIYASDLMSDVLAYGKPGSCLLTGLNTIQAAISSYMAEFKAIIFIRGKSPGKDICKFGTDKELVILSTKADMYEACIKIAETDGNLHISKTRLSEGKISDNLLTHDFFIDGSDFASAGFVSTQIKSTLKGVGYDPELIRRIAISTYESEMNVFMHARKAKVTLTAGENEIRVKVEDEGKGIPDVDLAMKEGYSTSTDEQRAMGFGAGMGLPNIKKNTDKLKILSDVGKGTVVDMRFNVK
ncbi:MAG: ATP-binding protein [Acidobacteriota bacterium]